MDVFGEIATSYDDVRPGYPPEFADRIRAYHGGTPATVVEIGAGTGKGTAVLLRLGAPITCLEPDPRMAARLTAAFPQVTVVGDTFEAWHPPPGGVPLLAAALSWHWLDPATRNPRARAALTPGGTLAVIGHRYDYADPDHGRAVAAALHAIDPSARQRPAHWLHDDIAGSGLFTAVDVQHTRRDLPLSTDRYLQLVRTFGPYRQRPADQRARCDAALRTLVDGLGGAIVLRLHSTLVLARHPG